VDAGMGIWVSTPFHAMIDSDSQKDSSQLMVREWSATLTAKLPGLRVLSAT